MSRTDLLSAVPPERRRMSRLLLAGLVAALGWLGRGAAEQAPAATYVGTPICVRCHIDFARRWESLAHSRQMLADEPPPELSGCEACHGPGSDHVAGDRKKIVAWAGLETAAASAVCLKCHQGKVEAELWTATIHSELMACDACHEVHHETARSPMLRGEEEGEECAECHGDLPDEAEAGRHHTLVDGALVCSMCHTFHGSANARLLMLPQEEMCAECHIDEDLRPENHQSDEWALGHGEAARADRETCLMCHDEQVSCQSCHIVPVPHAEDFAIEHTAAATEHFDACMRCHGEDYCKLCHEDVPRPTAPNP